MHRFAPWRLLRPWRLPRRDARAPLLRELARRGLTEEQLERAAVVPIEALRGWVESGRGVDA